MSIVGHAEPLDYDIYARDDHYFGYADADFKALIAQLDDSVDESRRRELLQRIQRKLAADAVNGFLFQYPRLIFEQTSARNRLRQSAGSGGCQPRPMGCRHARES